MNGLYRNIMSIGSATTFSASARLTNFNPDKILFYVSSGSAISKADLAKIAVTINFKNSVGSGIAVTPNLPLDMVADLNDFEAGNGGVYGTDTVGAFCLDIGKYCLRADDEMTFNISTTATLTNACGLIVKAVDTKIAKEKLISYAFISAVANQAYQNSGVVAVYGSISSPSDSVFITTDDFFGSNNLSEIAVIALGAAVGRAENVDNFGPVWIDDTGLSQDVTVRAGSSNERFLVKIWNFDANRIGYERSEFNSAKLLADSIQKGNPSKYKALRYYYG